MLLLAHEDHMITSTSRTARIAPLMMIWRHSEPLHHLEDPSAGRPNPEDGTATPPPPAFPAN